MPTKDIMRVVMLSCQSATYCLPSKVMWLHRMPPRKSGPLTMKMIMMFVATIRLIHLVMVDVNRSKRGVRRKGALTQTLPFFWEQFLNALRRCWFVNVNDKGKRWTRRRLSSIITRVLDYDMNALMMCWFSIVGALLIYDYLSPWLLLTLHTL